MDILKKENIIMGAKLTNQDEAVEYAGKLLVDSGYVDESYIDLMKEREKVMSTYMGNGLAIPHGVAKSREGNVIKNSGIVVIQVPEGVDFGNGNKAYMVIGIAGKDNQHLDILANIATIFSEEKNVEEMISAKDAGEIYKKFTQSV
ncbi:PTS sugar transporter subunit IIA [Alkalibacter saccharofermentans]|uniref:Mannitol-specific phosphotransferase enzyme IIA component n=1 Tax=Alkalibacter saccharofermentans DSM 14828 TaxID=1120975 RepID=A0A1M4YLY0_9FIRM|nr:PTS sugar transporter subunit IIA [Alkalibacter saccharofermentans]SHF06386.1 PTS system, mannitol-specific IIA component [Alkalibacter saccharofermentans DSM 14828]